MKLKIKKRQFFCLVFVFKFFFISNFVFFGFLCFYFSFNALQVRSFVVCVCVCVWLDVLMKYIQWRTHLNVYVFCAHIFSFIFLYMKTLEYILLFGSNTNINSNNIIIDASEQPYKIKNNKKNVSTSPIVYT